MGTGFNRCPLIDISSKPRPAIPGGLLPSIARFRFTGCLNDCVILRLCQENPATGYILITFFQTPDLSLLPSFMKLSISLSKDGLFSAFEFILGSDVSQRTVKAFIVIVINEFSYNVLVQREMDKCLIGLSY